MIDDSEDFLWLIRTFLTTEMPDAEVSVIDPTSADMPGDEFDWSTYDVLLLDYELGTPTRRRVEYLRFCKSMAQKNYTGHGGLSDGGR